RPGVPDAPRSAFEGFRRGLGCRCPNCGEGRLFRGYLSVDPACRACGHENARYRADDAPAYFTIFIVGHQTVPLLWALGVWRWETGPVLAVALPLVLAATLALLPFVKGAMIG